MSNTPSAGTVLEKRKQGSSLAMAYFVVPPSAATMQAPAFADRLDTTKTKMRDVRKVVIYAVFAEPIHKKRSDTFIHN